MRYLTLLLAAVLAFGLTTVIFYFSVTPEQEGNLLSKTKTEELQVIELTAMLERILFNDGQWKRNVTAKGCQIYIEEKPLRSCVVTSQMWKMTTTFDVRQFVKNKRHSRVAKFKDHDSVVLFFSDQTKIQINTNVNQSYKLKSGKIELSSLIEMNSETFSSNSLPGSIIQMCSGENRFVPVTSVGEFFSIADKQGAIFVDYIYELSEICEAG